MKKHLLFIIYALTGLTQYARAGDSVDLRSIQHKFVELGIKEERHYIADQSQWRTFWRRFSSEPEPKSVDLEKYDIVIFLMGTQPSGGYSVAIESVEKAQRHLTADNIVHVLVCNPPSDESQVSVVSAPYAVTVIPNRQGRVVWKTRKQVTGSMGCK